MARVWSRPVGASDPDGPDCWDHFGCEPILPGAGFRAVSVSRETSTGVRADEEAWRQRLEQLGWNKFPRKIEIDGAGRWQKPKQAVSEDLQRCKHADGIHFERDGLLRPGGAER